MQLNQIYHPITATPFLCNETYMELAPCDALKPYIRCFWGTKKPVKQKAAKEVPPEKLVIPDTCMDIIFKVNFTENKIHNCFCGINDSSFYAPDEEIPGTVFSTFAIRFYAWTAILFSEESMDGVKNSYFDAGDHFSKLKSMLEPLLFDVTGIRKRADIAQDFLLKHIHMRRENRIVMDGINGILCSRGSVKMTRLAKEACTGARQMERLFKQYTGVSPKQLASLVRYQYLWSSAVNGRPFNTLDAVHRLGYTDQAHLLNDFKRFHTMPLAKAKEYAVGNVAFLQEKAEKAPYNKNKDI